MGTGKRGRPSNPISPYTMKIHRNGKYRYASTQRPKQTDGESGTAGYRHFHWGTVDERDVFHPNSLFLYLPMSERKKFI